MPSVIYVPSRIGEGHFTDFQSPASGATDNGKIWAWNSATSKFEPIAIPSTSPGGIAGYVQYNNGGFAGHNGFVYDGAGKVTLITALVSPDIRPASNTVNSTGFSTASGTRVFSVDTANGRVGVNTTSPSATMDVTSANDSTVGLAVRGYSLTQTANLLDLRASNTALVFGVSIAGAVTAASIALSGGVRANGAAAQGAAPFVLKQASGSLGIIVTDDGATNRKDAYFGFDTGLSHIKIEAIQNGVGWLPVCLSPTGGSRVGVFGVTSPTAALDIGASTTSLASLRIRSGTAPTSPNDGDIWFDGTNYKCRIGGVTKIFTVT